VRRRTVLYGAVAAAVVAGLAACKDSGKAPGRSGSPTIAACRSTPGPSVGMKAAASTRPFLGVVQPPSGAAILARFDPLSLAPVSHRVAIAEYHDAWSLSPDRSQVALGMSTSGRAGRIGILVVDVGSVNVVRGIETGVAAEAVAWLSPRVLVGALQRGGTVLVDPVTGKILHRWKSFSSPDASARTADAFVMLAAAPGPAAGSGGRIARLGVVDARGRLRSVSLERIRLGVHSANGAEYVDRAALAVDPDRGRAYVFAATAPTAEIDLRTMRVSYRSLALGPGTKTKTSVLAQERRALWLGDGRVLVSGRDLMQAGANGFAWAATGAILVRTRTWSSCVLEAKAGGAAFERGRVLVYAAGARPGIGLSAYTVAGRKAFHRFDDEEVWSVAANGGRAYAQTPDRLHVVDVRSGQVLKTIGSSLELADVIDDSS
jgi:hypothetical protein